jgi:hypothetical protein
VTEALTAQGSVFGTLPYMAPEQLRGERVDARADIFSFGAMLYEMASGRRAFTGVTGAEVAASILKEDPPALEGIRTDLPAALVRIVRRCLEKDPRERIQSAGDLRHELSDLAEELRTRPAAPVVAAPRSGNRRLRFAATAGVAALAALAALLLIPRLKRPGGVPAGPAALKALAVLPFDNLMHDASQDYFVDGMHDALITEIAKLGVLCVTSRTSVTQYRGAKKPLKEIAKELEENAAALDAFAAYLRASEPPAPPERLVEAWESPPDREPMALFRAALAFAGALSGAVGLGFATCALFDSPPTRP